MTIAPERDDDLGRWGRSIASAQDPLLEGDAEHLRALREQLLDRDTASVAARRSSPLIWGAAVAMAAALVLVFARSISFDRELEFRIEGQPSLAMRDVVASADGEQAITFGEGTRVVVRSSSAIRIVSLDSDNPQLAMRSGSARFDVRATEHRAWGIAAGPYQVDVTGTSFELSWNEESRELELTLHEGSVRVNGPGIARDLQMSAGERLLAREGGAVRIVPISDPRDDARHAAASNVPELEPTAADEVRAPVDAPAADRDAEASPGPIEASERADERVRNRRGSKRGEQKAVPRISVDVEVQTDGWKQLAASGSYLEAFEAAREEGLDALQGSLRASDLLELADVARFAGRAETAKDVLETLRRRFPASKEGALAVYTLGRLASEHEHEPRDAVKWFSLYLREHPQGALAREALGRLVEAEIAAGQGDRARDHARTYLKRYPDGPHAKLCRGHLESSGL